MELNERKIHLIDAFKKDNFSVDIDNDIELVNDKIGIRAVHKTATIGKSKIPKKAYYLEGTPKEMGLLMGKLAESDIIRMCTEYTENFIPALIEYSIRKEYKILKKAMEITKLGKAIEVIIYLLSLTIFKVVPDQLKDELKGIEEACHSIKVNWISLWVLNVGIDAVYAFLYTFGTNRYNETPVALTDHQKSFLKEEYDIELDYMDEVISYFEKIFNLKIKGSLFNFPVFCNGFAYHETNSVTGEKCHYMGRDFMFPTCDVFQDTATLIIRKPDSDTDPGSQNFPNVSVAAPGLVGSITGLNTYGLGTGVNVSAGTNS